jgi:hypothetical protein
MTQVTLQNVRQISWNNIYSLLNTHLASSDTVIKGVFDETNTSFPVVVMTPVEVEKQLFSIDGSAWDGFITVNIEVYTTKEIDLDRVSDLVDYTITHYRDSLESDGMVLLNNSSSNSDSFTSGRRKIYSRILSYTFNADLND